MTCRRAQSLIEDLVDNELPESIAAELREYLARDPDCREEFDLSIRLKELLTHSDTPEPGDEYFTELQRLILARTVETEPSTPALATGEREPSKRDIRVSFVRSMLTLAASVCLFVAAVYYGATNTTAVDQTATPDDSRATSLVQVVNDDVDLGLTIDGRDRLTAGVMLLGPPGLLGRFTDLAPLPAIK